MRGVGTRVEADLVTAEQRDAFERDGYLVLDAPGVPESLLDAIVEDLDGLYERPPTNVEGVSYSRGRILDGWRRHSRTRELALAPQILAFLEELYGRKTRGSSPAKVKPATTSNSSPG